MTIEDLHKILSKGESLHLEFKEARIKSPQQFLRYRGFFSEPGRRNNYTRGKR